MPAPIVGKLKFDKAFESGERAENEVTEVATTEIATTFKILQTGNSYIRK